MRSDLPVFNQYSNFNYLQLPTSALPYVSLLLKPALEFFNTTAQYIHGYPGMEKWKFEVADGVTAKCVSHHIFLISFFI
jgi:hypothetical protein